VELKPPGDDHAGPVLLFFAVPEEARPFVRHWETVAGQRARRTPGPGLAAWECGPVHVHVTGMGRRNAARVGAAVLATMPKPSCVVTAGFAGGLNPALRVGAVLCEADLAFRHQEALVRAGARPGRIHEVGQVAVTPAAKDALWRETGADAVEMESATLRQLARAQGLAGATVRVISDAADDTLPLDFNALLTPEDRLDVRKLAWSIVRAPGKIPQLMAFQKTTHAAAVALARVLVQALRE
jgi:nucleoside phosphorylase